MGKYYFFLICVILVWHSSSAIVDYYMDNWCGETIDIDDSQIRLRLTASSAYAPNMKCQLTLSSFSERQMMIYFKYMDIEQSGTCDFDYLEMYDGSSRSDPSIDGGKHCGQDTPSGVFTTTGDYLTLYFQSDNSNQFRGFDMVITTYHTGSCYADEYECDNGRCIDDLYTCNDYNSCGDNSDCEVKLSVLGIAGIVFGGVVFSIVLIIGIAMCRRRRTVVVQQPMPVSAVSPLYGYNQPVVTQYTPPPSYQAVTTGTTYQQSYQKY